MWFVRIRGRTKVIENLEEMAKNSNVPTLGQRREFGFKEKFFMGEIPGLGDDPRSKL